MRNKKIKVKITARKYEANSDRRPSDVSMGDGKTRYSLEVQGNPDNIGLYDRRDHPIQSFVVDAITNFHRTHEYPQVYRVTVEVEMPRSKKR
jgi:hypothetical protein